MYISATDSAVGVMLLRNKPNKHVPTYSVTWSWRNISISVIDSNEPPYVTIHVIIYVIAIVITIATSWCALYYKMGFISVTSNAMTDITLMRRFQSLRGSLNQPTNQPNNQPRKIEYCPQWCLKYSSIKNPKSLNSYVSHLPTITE